MAEPIAFQGERDFAAEVEHLQPRLDMESADWDTRVVAMQRLEGLVLGGELALQAIPPSTPIRQDSSFKTLLAQWQEWLTISLCPDFCFLSLIMQLKLLELALQTLRALSGLSWRESPRI